MIRRVLMTFALLVIGLIAGIMIEDMFFMSTTILTETKTLTYTQSFSAVTTIMITKISKSL